MQHIVIALLLTSKQQQQYIDDVGDVESNAKSHLVSRGISEKSAILFFFSFQFTPHFHPPIAIVAVLNAAYAFGMFGSNPGSAPKENRDR